MKSPGGFALLALSPREARRLTHRASRERCDCGGYWFPHRRGGGACDASPRADFYRALRDGATREEAMQTLSVAQLEAMFPLDSERTP